MKAIFLMILAALFGLQGCGYNQRAANVPPVDTSANNTNIGNTPPASNINSAANKQAQQWNECRICDFDLANYKGKLSKEEIDGLLLALNDEYLAIAVYEQVNKDFNNPMPFANIVRAEQQHAGRLKQVFKDYGVAIPDNPWPGNAQKFASIVEACKASVEGEIVNRDLYKKLFDSTKREDILMVYRALQRASEQNHLPAFERCASSMRPGMGPMAPGRGQGRGPGGPGPGMPANQ